MINLKDESVFDDCILQGKHSKQEVHRKRMRAHVTQVYMYSKQ